MLQSGLPTVSSYCNGGNCVEVADRDGVIGVRDSKESAGPVLAFTTAEWNAFVLGVKNGEFDLGGGTPA